MTGAHHGLSECDALLDAVKYEEALACYEKILASNPRDVEALHGRADALLHLGRNDDVLPCCDAILTRDPADMDALFYKARALLNLDRIVESIECYNDVLEYTFDNSDILAEALGGYNAILAICPDNIDALRGRASALLNLGRSEEALKGYDAILERDPNDVDALQNKAAALCNLDQYEKALYCYDRILASSPDDPKVMRDKANAFFDWGRYQDALACYGAVLKNDPSAAVDVHSKATTLYNLKRYQEAITYYDDVLKLHPGYADALFYKGIALDGLGSHNQAGICIAKARDLDDAFALKKLAIKLILDTKYRILYNEEEILDARDAFFESLGPHAAETGYAALGFQSGQIRNCRLAYNKITNIWWDTNREDKHGRDPNYNRYWNCFGVGKPQWKRSNNIIVELNFPRFGVNRRIAGAMVKDRQNNLYLAHNGRINTSKGGAKLDWSEHHSILVDDGRKRPREMILVSAVTGSGVLDNVAKFVHRVAKSKARSR